MNQINNFLLDLDLMVYFGIKLVYIMEEMIISQNNYINWLF